MASKTITVTLNVQSESEQIEQQLVSAALSDVCRSIRQGLMPLPQGSAHKFEVRAGVQGGPRGSIQGVLRVEVD